VSGGDLVPSTNLINAPPVSSRNGFLSVFLSTGNSFGAEWRTQYPSAALHQLVTGDFDGDGKTDAAATTMYVTPQLVAFFGDGQASFPRLQQVSIGSTFRYEDGYHHLQAVDLNGDGLTDLASNGAADVFYGAPGGLTGPAHYFGPFVSEDGLTPPSLLVRPHRGAIPSIILPVADGPNALIYRSLCSRPRPVRR
jgi:hypothetical protein